MHERLEPRAFAKTLRRELTAAERVLWRILRGKRLVGLKFRRQVAIGPYVADFLCLGRRLVVELDGRTHDATYDARRDVWFASRMFRVLRISNEEVFDNPEGVARTILLAAEGGATPLPPAARAPPSPTGGEGLEPLPPCGGGRGPSGAWEGEGSH